MSVNLGRVAFVAKGSYNAATTYQQYDYVTHNNGSYVYISPIPAAGKPVTDAGYWQPLIDPAGMNNATAAANTAATKAETNAQTAATAAETANTAAAAADEARQNIQSDLAGKATAIFVGASGKIVTVMDGAAMPVKSLITHIEPVQEGEGDPSPENVRAISGWDAVEVSVSNENLLGGMHLAEVLQNKANAVIDTSTGTVTFSASDVSGKTLLSPNAFKANHQYKIVLSGRNSIVNLGTNIAVLYTDGTHVPINFPQAGVDSIRTLWTEAGKTVKAIIGYWSTSNTVLYYDECGVYEGNWIVPGKGQTLTAELPETIYGGSLDWNTGVLTVDRGIIVLKGNEDWEIRNPSNDAYFMFYEIGEYGFVVDDSGICTHYPTMVISSDDTHVGVRVVNMHYGRASICIRPTMGAYSTTQEFTTYLENQYTIGTPVQVSYKLANPYTIQLTPQRLEMLKGTNNIWSNAGETEVTYAVDTQMYIDQKIAAIAAAIV